MFAPHSLWEFYDMIKLGADSLAKALHYLALLQGTQIGADSAGREEVKKAQAPKESREDLMTMLPKLRAEAMFLDAPVTVAAIDRLVRNLADEKPLLNEDLVWFSEQIHSRLIDEIAARHVFVLSEKQRQYFDGADVGEEVLSKFPSAAYDIDEAAKCLALGRSTASVFHSMRVMEVALGAVHKCLGIAVALVGNDRNWGNILKRIRDNIKTRGTFAEQDVFQELYALLDAVKDAWRNATMHVEDKKTEDEAEVIFITVKSFMKKVASRMDENGLPLA